MYSTTITLFNRYQSRLNDMWYPTILHNVHLDMDKAAIIAKYGSETSDNAVLHVKYDIIDGKKKIENKLWLPPKEWDAQPNDSFSNSLTFTGGTDFDFFMVGKWEGGQTPISDNDYTSYEGFYNYMNQKKDYVFAITSVGGPYKVIKHFEIMAK